MNNKGGARRKLIFPPSPPTPVQGDNPKSSLYIPNTWTCSSNLEDLSSTSHPSFHVNLETNCISLNNLGLEDVPKFQKLAPLNPANTNTGAMTLQDRAYHVITGQAVPFFLPAAAHQDRGEVKYLIFNTRRTGITTPNPAIYKVDQVTCPHRELHPQENKSHLMYALESAQHSCLSYSGDRDTERTGILRQHSHQRTITQVNLAKMQFSMKKASAAIHHSLTSTSLGINELLPVQNCSYNTSQIELCGAPGDVYTAQIIAGVEWQCMIDPAALCNQIIFQNRWYQPHKLLRTFTRGELRKVIRLITRSEDIFNTIYIEGTVEISNFLNQRHLLRNYLYLLPSQTGVQTLPSQTGVQTYLLTPAVLTEFMLSTLTRNARVESV